MGAYPKPDNERVTRVPQQFGWVDLDPAGRVGDAPALPSLRDWSDATLAFWAELWTKPQATQWDQSGATLHAYAVLYQHFQTPEPGVSPQAVAAEMRQHEDRHGLNPKSMLQLRWRIASTDPAPASVPAKPKGRRGTSRNDRALKVIHGNPSA